MQRRKYECLLKEGGTQKIRWEFGITGMEGRKERNRWGREGVREARKERKDGRRKKGVTGNQLS